LWAILGKQQKRFVVLFGQTKTQAKQYMMNIRHELEHNEMLKRDLGPFQEENDEWGSQSLVFRKHGARITIASSDQSIRGIRHKEHRPDAIIIDDAEDIASTKTKEGRDKTYQWLTGEVIPAGDRNTRLIVIGNLLHEDSLLMRLKQRVIGKQMAGVFKMYPLLGDDDAILWPGKYPTMASIEKERQSLGNENAWQREYLLKIIPTEDAVIFPEWIHYYDTMPPLHTARSIRIGVDLAISEKETADYTAMVIGFEFIDPVTKRSKIYIDSVVINKRMDFPTTVQKCKELHDHYRSIRRPDFAIEDVGYQRSLPQTLEREGLSVRAVKVGSQDKRSRLMYSSHRVKNGDIVFPHKGAEILLSQILHFGVEKHDDVSDAFSTLMLDYSDHPTKQGPKIYSISVDTRPFNSYGAVGGVSERSWKPFRWPLT
jgi:predicted phage terminase large subunit-like protein